MIYLRFLWYHFISSLAFVVSGALGAKNTAERGLIPRILEYMFEEVAKRPEVRRVRSLSYFFLSVAVTC